MKALSKILGLVILALSLGIGWYWQKIQTFAQTPISLSTPSMEFEIKPGTSLTALARQLEHRRVIPSASEFLWMVRLQGLSPNVKAGVYELTSGLTPVALLGLFNQARVKQYALTIVEGWTAHQLLQALGQVPVLVHELAGKTPEQIAQLLELKPAHLEGQFLPDTYHFPAGTTDIAFLQRAHASLLAMLEREWPKRDASLPLKTPYEALILASIVEKETAVPSERSAIAGVFVRRLQKHMRLQTDPTVIYGLGSEYTGNLQKQHLTDKNNPYNTYRIKGLPPTPIALPGADAIRAVLHPAPGDALYFVAKGDGSHFFSATIKEHNAAVRKFQIRQRKADYRSTPAKKDPG